MTGTLVAIYLSMKIRKVNSLKRRGNQGQVALEYALTSLIMATVASLLYVFYQPIVISVFSPADLRESGTGIVHKDHGLGR
jgi:hypothetical protein